MDNPNFVAEFEKERGRRMTEFERQNYASLQAGAAVALQDILTLADKNGVVLGEAERFMFSRGYSIGWADSGIWMVKWKGEL